MLPNNRDSAVNTRAYTGTGLWSASQLAALGKVLGKNSPSSSKSEMENWISRLNWLLFYLVCLFACLRYTLLNNCDFERVKPSAAFNKALLQPSQPTKEEPIDETFCMQAMAGDRRQQEPSCLIAICSWVCFFVCINILSTHMYIYAYNQCLFPHFVCSQIPSFSVFQKYFMSYPPNAHRRFQWHKQRPSEYKYLKSKKIIHSQISSYFGSINSFPAAPGTKKLCLFSICNLDWIIY